MAARPDLAAAESTGARKPLLHSLIGYRLRRAWIRMRVDFATTMAPLELRPVLFAVLEVVGAAPGIIQMRVGTELGIQRANLVPLIAELEGRGLLLRRPSPHDRRAFALFLTPAGAALLDKAERMVRAHEDRVLASLSERDRRTLLELLEKIGTE